QPGLHTRARWAEDVLDDRPDSGFDVGLTMCPLRLAGDDLVQVSARRVDRRDMLQSSKRKQDADIEDINRAVANADRDGRKIRDERRPEVSAGREHEGRWHDYDDRECLLTEHDRAADDAGIAAELALPEAVAQDDRSLRAKSVVVGMEGPAGERRG